MINNWLITGDTHGNFTRLKNIDTTKCIPEETAIIVLGDAGFHFWLDGRDTKLLKKVSAEGFTIYCVKGNHEIRPSAILTMELHYDDEVKGEVWYEEKYPNIRFFKEVGAYQINNFSCLILGGAYSVDKYYRLHNYLNDKGWSGWFADEQLTIDEMRQCEKDYEGQHFDFVFSHTCPYSKRPTDMFLSVVDQSTVDSSMEVWMEYFINHITYGVHMWGHYHGDRIEAPHCEMMYMNMENLDDVYARWKTYDRTKQLDSSLTLGPKFYYFEGDN